uniref:Uncharacterized protein n=1 Tax=Panagrolaimus sp. PS1159 TaxID=55785 RepID=A0AC35F3Y2_9BILA
MSNTFSIDSLGMFECYDVWTHQSWVNHGASGSNEFEMQEKGSNESEDNENSDNIIDDNNTDEIQADQLSITSTDSYKDNVINFFNKIKDVAFGSGLSASKSSYGRYQAVPCQLEKF